MFQKRKNSEICLYHSRISKHMIALNFTLFFQFVNFYA